MWSLKVECVCVVTCGMVWDCVCMCCVRVLPGDECVCRCVLCD